MRSHEFSIAGMLVPCKWTEREDRGVTPLFAPGPVTNRRLFISYRVSENVIGVQTPQLAPTVAATVAVVAVEVIV